MKTLPFSSAEEIVSFAQEFDTPFYIYDESVIAAQCRQLRQAFSWAPGFQNYFAVKATPNPQILKIIKDEGFGADCSSLAELLLAESIGIRQESIYFTSNNSTIREYKKAFELEAILNLDDISHIHLLESNSVLPEHICFRFNPGSVRSGNRILGDPADAKFGMTKKQLFQAYEQARSLGCKRFSLHTMILSNCLVEAELFETAVMMFTLVKEIKDSLNIAISQVNLGGGFGIPYRPSDKPVDVISLGSKIGYLYNEMLSTGCFEPFKLSLECGRFITGPAGILVTRVINKKTTYKNYLGVDASIANLIRPAMYGSYHHVSHLRQKLVLTAERKKDAEPQLQNDGIYDVVGSLCENNDKLAVDRYIGPNVSIADVLVFHDAGAHCSAMGFHYNGKLQCAEYLRDKAGKLRLIRRKENFEDLFSTIVW